MISNNWIFKYMRMRIIEKKNYRKDGLSSQGVVLLSHTWRSKMLK